MTARASSVSTAALPALVAIEKRCHRARLVALTLLIMLLGAALGTVAFTLRSQVATATSLIRLNQPPDFAAVASGAGYSTPNPQPVTQGYVAGEVEFLSGEKFINAVADSGAVAEISATQASNSAVVSISSTAESPDEARASLVTVIDVYEKELSQRVEAQLSRILPVLDQWQSVAATDVLRVAEIARLREAIMVQAQQAQTVAVLQPPVLDDDGMPPWVSGAVLGALASGAAVWVVVLARRRSKQPPLVTQVAELVDGLILPPVKMQELQRTSSSRMSLARTMFAQIASPGTDQTIVVVGATPRSGTAQVALLLEEAAAETDSARIIDAGSIAEPTHDGPAIPTATQVVLVVRIDTDPPKTVLPVLSALDARVGPTLAAFTYAPWWHGLLTFRGVAQQRSA